MQPGNPEFGGPPQQGGPEFGKESPLMGKEYLERGGGIPIPATDLIEELQMVEIGENGDTTELERVLRETWSYRDGLTFGSEGYAYAFSSADLTSTDEAKKTETRTKVSYLQNLCYTVESSTARPRAEYLDIAIDDALDTRIRRAQSWHSNREKYEDRVRHRKLLQNKTFLANNRPDLVLSQEQIEKVVDDEVNKTALEYVAIPKLEALRTHSHTRKMYDVAFSHRMSVCEDPGRSAELGSSKFMTFTPDGTHWASIFEGEGNYGSKVNDVMLEMVKIALPKEVVERLGYEAIPAEVRKQVPESAYSKGFENAMMFATWMEHMLKKADGRMDVVWQAWKMMLTWEVADDLSLSIDPKKGSYVLASPPIANSLMTYLAHWEEKTTIEYGLDHEGKKRLQLEKFVGHSGLPMSMGHIPNLCEQYFIEAEVKFDESYIGKDWLDRLLLTTLRNLPKKGDKDYESESSQRQRYFDRLREDIVVFLVNMTPRAGNPEYDTATQDRKVYFDALRGPTVANIAVNIIPKRGEIGYDKLDKKGREQLDLLRERLIRIAHGETVERDGKTLDAKKVEISLWDMWLYGHLSFANKDFPWYATDQAEIDSDSGEPPSAGELGGGTVGMWYLKRSRCWGDKSGVAVDLKSVPPLRELGDSEFFIKRVRNWTKVLGKIGENVPADDNPRMWWVLGIMAYHLGGQDNSGKLKRGSNEDFRDISKGEGMDRGIAGTPGGEKGIISGDFLARAIECGFLRKIDVDYIFNYLNIKPF